MWRRTLDTLRNREPWERVLAIMFIAQLCSAVGFAMIFPFLPLYVATLNSHLGLSVELLSGLVFSAQALTMMIASPFWGALADRYGRKLMVERAMFGGALLLALMAFVRSAEDLVLLRALQGLITGTVSAANALVAAHAPRERSGYAMGVLQMGQWAGIAIGPVLGGAMADAFGYREAFLVTGALLLLAGLLVLWGVQDRPAAAAPAGAAGLPGLWDEWRHLLSISGVRWTYTLRFLTGLGNVMIVPILPLYVAYLAGPVGHLNALTGLIAGAASACMTVTMVAYGRLGDRIGHKRVLLVSALLTGLFYLPQSLVTSPWQLLALAALQGAAAGGIVPTLGALLARYTEPGEEGSVYGLDNSILAASRSVAPMAGSALALTLGMRSTFAVTGLLYCVVAGLAAWRLPTAVATVAVPLDTAQQPDLNTQRR